MQLASDFTHPPVGRRALLRWWWPGGAVDAAALVDQLRGFHAAGWDGVEIQPFRVGLPHPAPAAVHDVFTPRWFGIVAAVMDEAERLGMVVDLTFGSCWPPGGGTAITPELAAQELTLAWTPLRGPCAWQGWPPGPR